jgi:DNA-binding NarL/FixJ family response regulator
VLPYVAEERTCCACGKQFMGDREFKCPACRKPKPRQREFLTPHEQRLVAMLTWPTDGVASQLCTSAYAVNSGYRRLYEKAGIHPHTRAALLVWAAEHGYYHVEEGVNRPVNAK